MICSPAKRKRIFPNKPQLYYSAGKSSDPKVFINKLEEASEDEQNSEAQEFREAAIGSL